MNTPTPINPNTKGATMGEKKKRKHYPEDTRRKIAREYVRARKAGKSLDAVAERWSISRNSITKWISKGILDGPERKVVRKSKPKAKGKAGRRSIDTLITLAELNVDLFVAGDVDADYFKAAIVDLMRAIARGLR